MSQKPSVTIVSITGHQSYAEGSKFAIMRSYLELKDKIQDLRCLLISPEKPEELPNYIQYIPCQSFSYLEYNIFVLYSLGQLIDTDFALIVQNDGWVINGKNWDDCFFNYDYIGAPIPMLVEPNPIEHKPQGYHFWLEHYNCIPENMYEPQNGGFSLRSKKLLNAPRELNLKWDLSAPKLFESLPLKFQWKNGDHHEDIYLSVGIRKILEQNGIQFAPTSIAVRFAVENSNVQKVFNISQDEILGCHSAGTITLVNENQIKLHYNISSVEDLQRNLMTSVLYKLGYTIEVNMA